MIRFEDISYLYYLGAIPIFFLFFYFMLLQRKTRIKKMGDVKLIASLMPDRPKQKLWWKFMMYSFIYSLIIIGLANPQIGSKLENIERKGVDLMIALDVSNSMLAQDIKPNRLERAKRAISKLIDKLQGDRIGIVVFAGRAYTQLPITADYSAAKLFINTIDTDVVPTQGTSIGQAIDLSLDAFQENKHEKAIIVITDGEDHDDDPITAAEKAVEKGVSIYTIGIGLPEGAPIPEYSNGKQTGFKKDLNGKTVVTKLDEITLQKIAAAGKGIYVRANNTTAGLKDVFDRINKMEKQKYETKVFSDYEDRFQYFIGFALLLLLLDIFVTDKRSKWSGKFNIFESKTRNNE
ncbi:MAG: VWA domain-containing protein [Bacteroidales bacterium]|nr:VWA domain-containing protein [Bacteroidales bacterium]